MKYVVAFLRFWYEFIVGDDWRVAAGIGIAIALTAVLAGAGITSWWVIPAAVVVSVYRSLRRTTRTAVSFDRSKRVIVGPTPPTSRDSDTDTDQPRLGVSTCLPMTA
jgi:hypothetical protein